MDCFKGIGVRGGLSSSNEDQRQDIADLKESLKKVLELLHFIETRVERSLQLGVETNRHLIGAVEGFQPDLEPSGRYVLKLVLEEQGCWVEGRRCRRQRACWRCWDCVVEAAMQQIQVHIEDSLQWSESAASSAERAVHLLEAHRLQFNVEFVRKFRVLKGCRLGDLTPMQKLQSLDIDWESGFVEKEDLKAMQWNLWTGGVGYSSSKLVAEYFLCGGRLAGPEYEERVDVEVVATLTTRRQ